ncbi:MAG TPA: EF-P lysine aminoacylase EpmA [Gammaproteobacteria bacterium]|nr:EF-P lysine aminoacylase EpmA [Gammaproteobacteria bacterium]
MGPATPSDWRPGASLDVLKLRAGLLERVRAFFSDRQVMEVETPLLAAAGVTDPHLENLRAECVLPGQSTPTGLCLQTSPEYAMKRLLAAGAGPIYQITKAFRNGESGGLHNPEFTLLEWYRPGFDMHDLMGEIEDLLTWLLRTDYCDRTTYATAFKEHAGFDPLAVHDDELRRTVQRLGSGTAIVDEWGRDDCLDWVLSWVVGPKLGKDRPLFLCHFPASQAALARIIPDEDPPVAARFELFINGIEIASGFEELRDAGEQRRRFEDDNNARQARRLAVMPVDERLLAALEHGLPACSGVALGFDRLVMIAAHRHRLDEVMAFDTLRA